MNLILKPLQTPHELSISTALASRQQFSIPEKKRYETLQKGYLGEVRFYRLLQTLPSQNFISLFDLIYEQNGQEFQIDSLLINHDTLFLLEIKSFQGDYLYSNNKFSILPSKQEISNPITQIERSEYLFKQLLHEHKIPFRLQTYILFINENFMLYQTPPDLPFIFKHQINHFINRINSNTNYSTASEKVAHQLINLTKTNSSYERLPKYNYPSLRKGLFCKKCTEEYVRIKQSILSCETCGKEITIEKAIVQAVHDFTTLFPSEPITIANINDWTGNQIVRKTMRRILKKNFTYVKKHNHSHYLLND